MSILKSARGLEGRCGVCMYFQTVHFVRAECEAVLPCKCDGLSLKSLCWRTTLLHFAPPKLYDFTQKSIAFTLSKPRAVAAGLRPAPTRRPSSPANRRHGNSSTLKATLDVRGNGKKSGVGPVLKLDILDLPLGQRVRVCNVTLARFSEGDGCQPFIGAR